MSLTLTIENMDRLDNGEPVQLKLDRHGAVIGRSPHSDWSLPDPKSYISSTHCEIDYRNGVYLLLDKSTNGTFVNNAPQRMDGPHVLKDGDVISIGHYKIAARTQQAVAAKPAAPPPTPGSGGWSGWGEGPSDTAPVAQPSSGWDAPAPAARAANGWEDAPPAAKAGSGWEDTPPAKAASGWDSAPPPSPAPASASAWSSPPPSATPLATGGWAEEPPAHPAPAAPGWASPPPAASAPAAGDGWGAAAARPPGPKTSPWDNAQPAPPEAPLDDWGKASAISGRGAMAQNWTPPSVQSSPADSWNTPAPPAAAPPVDPADIWGAFASSNEVDWGRGGFGAAASPAPAPPPADLRCAPPMAFQTPAGAPVAAPAADPIWPALARGAGLEPDTLKAPPAEAAQIAGVLLKRLVAGLVVMVEARARAKAQLGAQSTTLELNGNNPLKFARDPERVLAQLLNPPERGFMTAEQAIQDSFQDLQAHQMATLAAMQGALASTLARFSPEAIRKRAESRGVLAKIIPAAREAELWNAYEREFEGVARGSDEAFMDVFAKEFKQAYERAAADMKRRG